MANANTRVTVHQHCEGIWWWTVTDCGLQVAYGSVRRRSSALRAARLAVKRRREDWERIEARLGAADVEVEIHEA